MVYGPRWGPTYQPVVWAPWPGYVRVHRPGIAVAFWWGARARLSPGFYFGGVDWHHRHVRVVHVHHHYVQPQRQVHLVPKHWPRYPRQGRVVVERRIAGRAVAVLRPAETRIVSPPPARAIEAPHPRRDVHRERARRDGERS